MLAMDDAPLMFILSSIVMATEAVEATRFYDDVYPDHHKTPDFAMLDTVTNETVADRDLQGLVQPSVITTDPTV